MANTPSRVVAQCPVEPVLVRLESLHLALQGVRLRCQGDEFPFRPSMVVRRAMALVIRAQLAMHGLLLLLF